MASPEGTYRKLGVRGAIAVGIGLVVANKFGPLNISESKEPIFQPQTQTLDKPEISFEAKVVSENLTLALHWIAFQRNPVFDRAIADISRIQGEIFLNGNLIYIADLNTNSFDENYAEVLYRKDENGESVNIAVSEDRFSDRVFNTAEAGRDLLIAWKKHELAKNQPQRFRNDPDFKAAIDQLALDFTDTQLARH